MPTTLPGAPRPQRVPWPGQHAVWLALLVLLLLFAGIASGVEWLANRIDPHKGG